MNRRALEQRVLELREDPEFLDRFFSKVDVREDAECWEWKAGRMPEPWPYGMFGVMGEQRHIPLGAHRVAFILANAVLPGDGTCCHACDNPPCVNPKHIWLGTAADNMQDAADKGRLPTGERHVHTKLTRTEASQVTDMLNAGGFSQREIGNLYGVSQTVVATISQGKTWKGAGPRMTHDRGRRVRGENGGRARLTEIAVLEIRELLRDARISYAEIADRFGVAGGTIQSIAAGKNWAHLGPIPGLPARVRGQHTAKLLLRSAK